jgi:hypothetical protein
MIGTGAGLSVQTAAMEVQWCVSQSMFCRQAVNFSPSFSSYPQLDKEDAPLVPEAYIHLPGVQYHVSFSDDLTGYTFPLQHLAVQKLLTGYRNTKPRPGHKLCSR